MFISALFLTVTRKFVPQLFFAAFLFLLIAFGAHPGLGQDSLRNSVYGNKKPSTDSNKNNLTPKKKTPSLTTKKPKRQPVKTFVSSQRRMVANNFVTVTFVGKEPMVEIWLNDKNIGATDDKFQFSKKLAPGEYRLMAKNNRQVLLPSRMITINAEQNSFNLFNEVIAKPVPKKEPTPEKVEEKSELEVALEISNKVKTILETYANPATTDSVTLEDWQIVFQAAQLGQLQGYTAVQIEAQRWFASGQIELAKFEYVNAFTAFNKAQEFMPSSALPFYELGNTYLAKKQLPDALKSYLRAVSIDPKLAMAHKKLGDVQRLLGKEKEAISAYKNALQFGYQTPETRYWLGTLMLETKQIEEAIQELENVAKEMPKAEVFISIGEGYEKLKRDVSAIENYLKAIETDPNSAIAHYKLANVYFNQREHTKAKDAFEKAIELDPEGKAVNLPEAQKKLREAASKLNK